MSVDKTLMQIGYDDYEIKEIANNVFKINEFNLTTMFVIVGNERALAIDCGTGVGDYKKVLLTLTKGLPYDLAITHAHIDHIGGMSQFNDFYLSEKDVGLVKDVTVSGRVSYMLLMKFLGFKVRKNKYLHFDKCIVPKIHTISEGYTFDLGGRTVKVIETKGHTIGSISYLLTEERILFSGDIVNPQNLMFLKNATTIEELNETYKKLLNMDSYDTMWASHLSMPVSRDILEDGLECTNKLIKRKNTRLPLLSIGKHNGYVIIHRSDRRKLKFLVKKQ